jgi:hypothetical protein
LVQPNSAVGGRQQELARLVNSSGAHGQAANLIDEFGEVAQTDRSFPSGRQRFQSDTQLDGTLSWPPRHAGYCLGANTQYYRPIATPPPLAACKPLWWRITT